MVEKYTGSVSKNKCLINTYSKSKNSPKLPSSHKNQITLKYSMHKLLRRVSQKKIESLINYLKAYNNNNQNSEYISDDTIK